MASSNSITDFPPDSTNTRNGIVRKKWPKLTTEKRTQIVQILLQNYNEKDKKLQWGIVKKTVEQFHATVRTINNIWSKARTQINDGCAIDMQSNMRGNVGRKRGSFSFRIRRLFNKPQPFFINKRGLDFNVKVGVERFGELSFRKERR
ncbi:hypothetical protein OROGR_022993 [Orobanche gracilis]